MLALAHQRMLQGSLNPRLYVFPAVAEIFDVCERNGIIVAGGSSGKVFVSSNGGWSWTTYDLTSLIGWVGDVRVVFNSHGFYPNTIRVWGANGYQAYSDNNGTTWTLQMRTAPTPLDTLTDVDDTNGYLLGCSSSGGYAVDVGGNLSGGSTGAGDSWMTCARDPNDATHALIGTGNKIFFGNFGFPPPTGHSTGTFTKGTTVGTVGAYFDSSNNMMFINADGSYGYKNKPAYTASTAPTQYTSPVFTGANLNGLTFDRVNTLRWAICGRRNNNDRIWTSTQAAPHTWTEWNPYSGQNVWYWNRIDRDSVRGTWVTGGKTVFNQGCIGIWKA